MLYQLLMSGDLKNALVRLALILPAVLLCLSIHEASHGFMAYALGDRTALRQGRLTLDPFAHIDPVGFFCMVLFGFGWARPVPVNISNFKNRRFGMALTALAGPLSNFITAFVAFFLADCMSLAQNGNMLLYVVMLFLTYVGSLSIGLGVFNLIPVYPLDGSRILDAFLPFDLSVKLQKYQQFIFIAIIAIVWIGGLDSVIGWVSNAISGASAAAFYGIFG